MMISYVQEQMQITVMRVTGIRWLTLISPLSVLPPCLLLLLQRNCRHQTHLAQPDRSPPWRKHRSSVWPTLTVRLDVPPT